jgi:uncharacterized RmlC-like cupin family protein
MKIATLIVLVCAVAVMFGSSGSPQNVFTPDQMKWGPPPPFVAPGAQLAVLEGDPGPSSGDFTIRLKMPAGYKIAPHWHPKRENVTVISGNFKVGMGDKWDDAKMATFAPGSFAYLDPEMHHYAQSGETETIVQVHGMSPLQFNYVNPEDDPSKKIISRYRERLWPPRPGGSSHRPSIYTNHLGAALVGLLLRVGWISVITG